MDESIRPTKRGTVGNLLGAMGALGDMFPSMPVPLARPDPLHKRHGGGPSWATKKSKQRRKFTVKVRRARARVRRLSRKAAGR